MTGPFEPDDFKKQAHDLGEFGTMIRLEYAANVANSIDSKRWACEMGGEHDAVMASDNSAVCARCLAKLKAKWEAV